MVKYLINLRKKLECFSACDNLIPTSTWTWAPHCDSFRPLPPLAACPEHVGPVPVCRVENGDSQCRLKHSICGVSQPHNPWRTWNKGNNTVRTLLCLHWGWWKISYFLMFNYIIQGYVKWSLVKVPGLNSPKLVLLIEVLQRLRDCIKLD